MNNMISRYMGALMLLVASLALYSCDDSESGQPEITGVRLVDPDKADSTFVEAERGTMIVIEGHNIDGVVKAYINSQEVGFNSTYNTATHMIITIPDELVLTAEDNSLENEISWRPTTAWPPTPSMCWVPCLR